jgi:fungal STAND N-terminal Goodbye domain
MVLTLTCQVHLYWQLAPFIFGVSTALSLLSSYSDPPFSLHTAYPLCTNEPPVAFMSSTGQLTFSSNSQLIFKALADYAKLTGIDLTKNPFTEKIELSNSPEAILQLLQERQKAFKEYREMNRRLITCLTPAVEVLHALSGILGDAVSMVSDPCHLVNPLTWPC